MHTRKTGPLEDLIRQLASLPGLGPRSARRAALHLLVRRREQMLPLAHALEEAAQSVRECDHCGNLDVINPCGICQDTRRDKGQICVVADISDVWAIERTGAYQGLYHVLGGVLSALDGVGPEQLRLPSLLVRVQELPAREIILALSATVDGQSTAHYISDHLTGIGVGKITRLAHGVPVGGELDYLDDGTIITALRSRSAA